MDIPPCLSIFVYKFLTHCTFEGNAKITALPTTLHITEYKCLWTRQSYTLYIILLFSYTFASYSTMDKNHNSLSYCLMLPFHLLIFHIHNTCTKQSVQETGVVSISMTFCIFSFLSFRVTLYYITRKRGIII
ncbi:hypothetical protein DWW36_17845 [Erysipelotrichaceae bacterium AF15-26LB]|nr:hypothetical protein DWX45_19865 [Erysipelotrichaceae bacterium AF19-24AC]RJV83652.1 hypothetical protein DWW36_17845 [Erysipelotrichaceae bacterium AF15-26LB]